LLPTNAIPQSANPKQTQLYLSNSTKKTTNQNAADHTESDHDQ
jgi:hypothetical protein